MKNKIVSLLAIIFGIMIIAFPMIGIISSGAILGLSLLLISIFTLMTGLMIIDYNTSGAIIDIILSMILLFISIGIIFNPTLIGFLTEISLYLGKNGFYIGIAGIILGVIYIIVGTYVANPIILGTLIGIWLVISGVMRLIY